MDIKNLQALVYELRNLYNKIRIYYDSNEYIYANIYKEWTNDYNNLLQKYNALSELHLTQMQYSSLDLSTTQKTVKTNAIKHFIGVIDSLVAKIESEIENEHQKLKQDTIPNHQMRRCFKLGMEYCPLKPSLKKNKVFVAMPFDNMYLDSYHYGIIPALNGLGFEHYRADSVISNKDIMCKICEEIQSCELVIVNISGLNPNVMLEYGIAYGIGKSVIIIKDKATKAISDMGCLEYIEYEHAHDLMQKLCSALQNK